MNARILLLVAILNLPYFNMAQILSTQQTSSLRLNQKQFNNTQSNKIDLRLSYPLHPIRSQKDSLTSSCDNGTRSLYVLRLAGFDHEDCINFYGLSLGLIHYNKETTFSGLAISLDLGDPSIPVNNICVNGINIGVLNTTTTGTINGISISGISEFARNLNGLEIAIWGMETENLNGVSIGGFASFSNNLNGIKISFINVCCTFKGLALSFFNYQNEGYCREHVMSATGLAIGVINVISIQGLSLAVVNKGNSSLQIGLLNIGDSTVQLGLVNLDSNGKMGIPLINVNF